MAYEIDPVLDPIGPPPRDPHGRPSEAWCKKFTGTSRIVAEELAVFGAAADDDLVTIEDGRKFLAVEYVALMGFAYANQISEWTLWRRVKRGRSGRVTVVGPRLEWYRVRDISALAGCTEIKRLYLGHNRITDISPLARCSELRELWLGLNRITDISALASCAKLDTLYIGNNSITDISALTGCSRLASLNLQGNRLTDISVLPSLPRLGWVYLGHNQITDISALERCRRLQAVSVPGNPLAEGSEEVLMLLHERGVAVDY